MLVRHYKGGLYRVIIPDGLHTETGERLVGYTSLEDDKMWFRPFYDFYGTVKLADGTEVCRFENVEEVEEEYWDEDSCYDAMKRIY